MLVRSLVVSVMVHSIPVGIMLHESADMLEDPPEMIEDTPAAGELQEHVDNLPPVRITLIDEVRQTQNPVKRVKVEVKKAEPDVDTHVANATVAEPEPVPVVEDVVAEAVTVEAPIEEQIPTEPVAHVEPVQAPVDECPPDRVGIVAVTDNSWAVDRKLVDFYATHLKELTSLAWVPAHKDENGKPDGFKVILKKCSILRNGGLQSQDVVTDVGGVRVHSIFTAIKAYVKLRKKSIIPLTVKRNDQEITLTYELR